MNVNTMSIQLLSWKRHVDTFVHQLHEGKMKRRNAIDHVCHTVDNDTSHCCSSGGTRPLVRMKRRGAIYQHNPLQKQITTQSNSKLPIIHEEETNCILDISKSLQFIKSSCPPCI